MFFEETVSFSHYIYLVLAPFFKELIEEKKVHSCFMQGQAMAHTASFSIAALAEVSWQVVNN